MNRDVSCFTIPGGDAFLQTLAGWALERYGATPESLANVRILLPNRRAARALAETFLDTGNGRPMLLPRLHVIGDIGEEDLPAPWLASLAHDALPPAIAPARRLLLLAQLVQKFETGRMGEGEQPYPPGQAMQQARQLARFIDDAAREGADMKNLQSLVPEELAAHWQQTLDFLSIVSVHWPKALEAEGALDPVDHRNRLLAALAESWKQNPPPYPVIAAGSTGTQPATAALLSVIARMHRGTVILPGLDQAMPKEQWEQVDATHPQYALKSLLKSLGCARDEVRPLTQEKPSARMETLAAAFQPPPATARWQELTLPIAEGLKNVRFLEADTQADEARMVAVALRETLETPGKTAALVTPDRQLARMVAVQMQRFGVTIDDTAGTPLGTIPAGNFLRLVISAATSQAAPAPLLAMLRHPLAAAGMDTAECRRLSRLLETELLRGVRHAHGMKSLVNDAARRKDKHPELFAFTCTLEENMRALSKLCARRSPVPAHELLQEHLAFAQWLAGTPQESGEERLWAGDAGEQLSESLMQWMEHGALLPATLPSLYPAWFDTLLDGEVYRPRYRRHARLAIMSPIEARLLRFDRVILSGLSEGSWPALPAADPWMSRPMRKAFGLPPAEREIGQGAHDVMMLAAASPEVFFTRARKADGAPTVASRWLVRLHTLASALEPAAHARACDASRYERAIARMDAPVAMAALSQPMPVPPLAARPRAMKVTAIDTWNADAYIIYAQYVLGLKALDALDEEPGKADFGTLVHRALERFTREWPKDLPPDPREVLLQKGREAFADFLERPAVATLWWPRFEAMSEWLIDRERERRAGSPQLLPELKGEWTFKVDGKDFTLVTRIDRMELAGDGSAVIVDYKTGNPPKDSDQLPLEALVAQHGTLTPGMHKLARITGLQYWKLAGRPEDCRIVETYDAAAIEDCHQRLVQLIRRFDNAGEPFAAQANRSLLPRFNDYEHFTRRDEWETV